MNYSHSRLPARSAETSYSLMSLLFAFWFLLVALHLNYSMILSLKYALSCSERVIACLHSEGILLEVYLASVIWLYSPLLEPLSFNLKAWTKTHAFVSVSLEPQFLPTANSRLLSHSPESMIASETRLARLQCFSVTNRLYFVCQLILLSSRL